MLVGEVVACYLGFNLRVQATIASDAACFVMRCFRFLHVELKRRRVHAKTCLPIYRMVPIINDTNCD